MDSFANRLMLVRAHAGHISISRAAEITGLGRGAWQNWERGTPPTNMAAIVELIATVFDVEREWLMWGGPLGQSDPGPKPTRIPSAVQNAKVRDGNRRPSADLVTAGHLAPVLQLQPRTSPEVTEPAAA